MFCFCVSDFGLGLLSYHFIQFANRKIIKFIFDKIHVKKCFVCFKKTLDQNCDDLYDSTRKIQGEI